MAQKRPGPRLTSEPSPLTALVQEALQTTLQTALLARFAEAATQEADTVVRELLQDEQFRQDFLTIGRAAAREAVARLAKGTA